MHRTVAAAIAGLATAVATLSIGVPAGARPLDTTRQDDPTAFLTRVVGYIVADEYERAWQSLLPAHKTVAPRREYVACELRSPIGLRLVSARAVRVARKPRRVPGLSRPVPVTSVRLRLTVDNPATQSPQTFTLTVSAVRAASRWAWILTPSRYELYRSGACPA